VEIFVFALYAAIYPTLLAAVGVLLAHPRRRQLMSVFLFAGLGVSVGCGIAIVLLVHGSGAVKHKNSGWSWGTDVTVGSLLLLLALGIATHAWQRLQRRRAARRLARRGAPESAAAKEPWSQRLLAKGSLPIVLIAAIVINVPGAVYLVALKDIAAGRHSVAVEVVLVLAFNLIMFVLAEAPWVGLMLAPERTVSLVDRANRFLLAHMHQFALAVSTIAGLHLVIRGLVHA
jgi:Sap, sulfolipid-1-addressing protein